MGAIAMRIRSKKGLSVIQRGLAVLRKVGSDAHFWTAGTGWLNGVQAANFLDSAGTTAASVDNPIGLVLDQLSGQGALGAELAPQGPLDFTTGAWTKSNGSAAVSANVVTFPTAGTSEVLQSAGGQNSAGKSYLVTFTASGNGTLSCGVTNRTDLAVRQQLPLTGTTQVFTALITQNGTASVNAGLSFFRASGDTCTQATITTCSWKQILGISASQATTARKPTLRRGVVNRIPQNKDLTSAFWSKFWGTVANVQTALPDGTTGACSRFTQDSTASQIHRVANASQSAAGMAYTNVAILRGDGTRYVYLNANAAQAANVCIDLVTGAAAASGSNVSGVYTRDLGGGWWWVQFNGIGTGAAGNFWLQANSSLVATDTSFTGDGVSSFLVASTAQFDGVLTYGQIVQCGGIPVTANTAASSSGGNWGWQFFAANVQRITTATPVVSMNSDHFLCAGVRCDDASLGESAFLVGAYSPTNLARVGELHFAYGKLACQWVTDAVSVVSFQDSVVSTGVPLVATAIRNGATVSLRKNSVQIASGASVSGTTSTTGASIGCNFANSVAQSPFTGVEFAAVIVNGSVSTSDALAIERMVGALTGPTGVIF